MTHPLKLNETSWRQGKASRTQLKADTTPDDVRLEQERSSMQMAG